MEENKHDRDVYFYGQSRDGKLLAGPIQPNIRPKRKAVQHDWFATFIAFLALACIVSVMIFYVSPYLPIGK